MKGKGLPKGWSLPVRKVPMGKKKKGGEVQFARNKKTSKGGRNIALTGLENWADSRGPRGPSTKAPPPTSTLF